MPLPRIALAGFMLESNGHSPVATEAEFEALGYFGGNALAEDLAKPNPRASATMIGFVEGMNGGRAWTLVPIAAAQGGASGPVDQTFFEEVLERLETGLKAAMPLDGVFLSLHGAATATGDFDPDATVLRLVRSIVGPDVPIIGTLDLHANVSQAMVDLADALVAYLTNPHVDMRERGRECAAIMRAMLGGMRPKSAFVKLPLIPPSITQNTKSGPYADIIRYGQSKLDHEILNVSICSGFTLGDTPKNGMTVTVTARTSAERAREVAFDIATTCWADRRRYVPKMTSLEEVTAMALAAGRDVKKPALLFADVADNPGGGGRGNTTWILGAFHKAGAEGVLLGIFNDPALAAEAHDKGKGAAFTARFNRDEADQFSKPFTAEATVEALHDGNVVGRRGVVAGRSLRYGKTALLKVGGVRVVVISIRQQCCDPVAFEMFGLDIAKARSVIVKSRGHFRAGFDEFFADGNIVEVDVPGLTTPVLSRVPYRNLPRPIFPLDPDASWTPT
ncbi:MAG: M81 family metallopeptidase [Alphaproteobacteria bacterium]|nr:M81 family metallopeptidase [Alphaproteobacteria bacterium]